MQPPRERRVPTHDWVLRETLCVIPLPDIKARIEAAVPGATIDILVDPGPSQQGSLLIDNEHGPAVAKFLRDDPALRLDFCSNVTGVDWLDRTVKKTVKAKTIVDGVEKEIDQTTEEKIPGYLEAVYHLYSMAQKFATANPSSGGHGPVVIRMRTTDRADGGMLSDSERTPLEAALTYFATAAPRHTADEEEGLFPRLEASLDRDAITALNMIRRLESDHDEANRLHEAVDRLVRLWLANGSLADSLMRELKRHLARLNTLYAAHIAIEDREVFPRVGEPPSRRRATLATRCGYDLITAVTNDMSASDSGAGSRGGVRRGRAAHLSASAGLG